MERPLRLITTGPLDGLARTLEALLVVAAQPLTAEDLAVAADDDVGARRAGPRAPRWSVRRGAQRHRPRARCRRICVPRLARRGRCVRATVRAPGRARPFAGRARDARRDRVSGAVQPSGRRADPRRGRRFGRRGPRRAWADRRSRARDEGGASATARRRSSSACSASRAFRQLPRLDDLGGTADEIRGRLEAIAERRPA